MNKTEIVDRAFNEGTIEAVNAALIARFDSSLIYEVPLFKCYVDTMLRGVPADSEAYPICNKLLQFIMKEIASLTPNEINMIPSTSVVREFIGGSSFIY